MRVQEVDTPTSRRQNNQHKQYMPMPIFNLVLQKTYFNQGFFNVSVDYDRFVRKTEGQIKIKLGGHGLEILGTISRKANRNGTARIMGNAALKNWFQNNFEPMDTVAVDLSSQDIVVLDKPNQQI